MYTSYSDISIWAAMRISEIEDKVYNRRGFTSRPFGRDYMLILLECAVEIVNSYLDREITDEVLNLLEDWNAHTACHAASVVKEKVKYAMYDYAERPTYDLVVDAETLPF